MSKLLPLLAILFFSCTAVAQKSNPVPPQPELPGKDQPMLLHRLAPGSSYRCSVKALRPKLQIAGVNNVSSRLLLYAGKSRQRVIKPALRTLPQNYQLPANITMLVAAYRTTHNTDTAALSFLLVDGELTHEFSTRTIRAKSDTVFLIRNKHR